VGPRAGLDVCGKSHLPQHSIPEPSSPLPVCTDCKQNKVASVNERYYKALEKYSFSDSPSPSARIGEGRKVTSRFYGYRRTSIRRRHYDASVLRVIKLYSFQ